MLRRAQHEEFVYLLTLSRSKGELHHKKNKDGRREPSVLGCRISRSGFLARRRRFRMARRAGGGGVFLRQQLFDAALEFLLQVGVEFAAGGRRETGMDRFHLAVAADEDGGGPGVEIGK